MNPHNHSIVVPVMPDRERALMFKDGPLWAMDAADTRFSRADFNLRKLCESVYKQMEVLWGLGVKARHLVLGRDFYQRFMKDVHLKRETAFDFPHNYLPRVEPYDFQMMFYGLRVHCIPWMEGVVILPELGHECSYTRPRNGAADLSPIVVTTGESILQSSGASIKIGPELPPKWVKDMLGYMRDRFVEWAETPCDMNEFLRRRQK